MNKMKKYDSVYETYRGMFIYRCDALAEDIINKIADGENEYYTSICRIPTNNIQSCRNDINHYVSKFIERKDFEVWIMNKKTGKKEIMPIPKTDTQQVLEVAMATQEESADEI